MDGVVALNTIQNTGCKTGKLPNDENRARSLHRASTYSRWKLYFV
jgi:hypothetical protein